MRVQALWLLLIGALVVAGLTAASPATAARPVGGARYFGIPGGVQPGRGGGLIEVAAKLRLSRSGRSFAPTTMTLSCAGSTSTRVRVHGGSGRRSRVAVSPAGRFTTAGRRGRLHYRLHGRFITRDRARIVYAVRAPARSRTPWRCHGRSRGSIVLYRNGKLPFSGCSSQRASTLFSTSTGRVLQQWKLIGKDAGVTHAYACLFANPSRRFDLGENLEPDSSFDDFRLVGPLLGFFRVSCAMCAIDSRSIEVRDLRDGSVVRTAPVRTAGPFPSLLGYPALYSLWKYVLKENGSLAWTLARYSLTNPYERLPRQEVWALDAHGQRLLDAGPDIDPESLALNRSTLTWINAGATRSATLY